MQPGCLEEAKPQTAQERWTICRVMWPRGLFWAHLKPVFQLHLQTCRDAHAYIHACRHGDTSRLKTQTQRKTRIKEMIGFLSMFCFSILCFSLSSDNFGKHSRLHFYTFVLIYSVDLLWCLCLMLTNALIQIWSDLIWHWTRSDPGMVLVLFML